MTDDWRRYQGMNSRSKNGRPPSGPRQNGVPSWEKRFCSSVCLIPWRKLCETKKMMDYYQSIVDWNDSAGEEAFFNAKARFWAEINGLPCPSLLPDPDMYIDEIDWNCAIDPDLVADLEQQPEDQGNDETLGNGLDPSFLNQPIQPTGWGDDPEPLAADGWGSSPLNQPVACTGWDDAEDPPRPANDFAEPGWGNSSSKANNGNAWNNSSWESTGVEENAWENGWRTHNRKANKINAWNPSGWENRAADDNSWENNGHGSSSWENGHGNSSSWGRWDCNPNEFRNLDNRRHEGHWGMWTGNGRRREGWGRFGSRHHSWRYVDDYHMNGWGRNNNKGKKRSSFAHERSEINKRPLAPSQWNSMRYCGPVTHDGPVQSDNVWRSWEKPVS